jgi:hypothetical protein
MTALPTFFYRIQFARSMITETNTPENGGPPPKGQKYAVAAGILGWTLDSFDFFVVVFLVDVLAQHFQVTKSSIVLTLGATLFAGIVRAGDSHVGVWTYADDSGDRRLFDAGGSAGRVGRDTGAFE